WQGDASPCSFAFTASQEFPSPGATEDTSVRPGHGMLAGGSVAERDYAAQASAGIEALQRWYRPRTGRGRTAGWWNAANALTAVIGYMQSTADRRYLRGAERTFVAAQRRHRDFIVSFYDDNGWWGLAWGAAYDLTRDDRYLAAARTIFANLGTGWGGTCGGGVAWTYNQGVILGGLSALYEATGETAYLTQGEAIADAALGMLTTPPVPG